MRRFKLVALLICLSLIMSMAVSCSGSSKERTKRHDRDDDEEETEIETETEETTPTEAPTEPTEEPTTEPTEEPTTEPPVTTPEIYVDQGFGSMRYSTYMSLCSELNDANKDYLFGFREDFDNRPIEFDLLTYDPDSKILTTYYCDDSGNLIELDTNRIDAGEEYMIEYLLTFDELSKYPCMIDADYMNSKIEFVSSLPDGKYFGSIDAISNDGTKALLSLGEGVILSEEEYKNLKVGDKIKVDFYDTEYITVTEVNDTDDPYMGIRFDIDYVWFSQGAYTDNSTDYVLLTDSDVPVSTNDRLVIIDLASDCEVDDTFGWLMAEGYEEGMKKMIEDEGYTNPLQTSSFWYFHYTYEYKIESSNGWTPMWGLVLPAVVKNGELVKFCIGWR